MYISILLTFLIACTANLVSIAYNSHFDLSLNNSTLISLTRIAFTIFFLEFLGFLFKKPWSHENIMDAILFVVLVNGIIIVLQICDALGMFPLPALLKYGALTNLILDQTINDTELLRKGGLFWSFQIAGFLTYIAIFYEIFTKRRFHIILFLLFIIAFTSRMYFLMTWIYFGWLCFKLNKINYILYALVLLAGMFVLALTLDEFRIYFYERIYKIFGWIFDDSLILDDSIAELLRQWRYAFYNISIFGNQMPRSPNLGGGGDAFLPRWLVAGGIITAIPMTILYALLTRKILNKKYGNILLLPLILGFFKDDFLLSAFILPLMLIYIKARD